MHSYLRSIGFSNINNRSELNKLINLVLDDASDRKTIQINYQNSLTELSMKFGPDFGITLRGEYDQDDVFHLDNYYPFLYGYGSNVKEEVSINKRVDTEAYTGMCDDYRLGVSLIFYLQNVAEYLEKHNNKKDLHQNVPITLSALSLEGRILLPIVKDEIQVKNLSAEKINRSNLIAEAKKGNQDAIDSLTLDDIDTYAMVSRRAKKEDIYSIVDTCFIPFGSESDNYSIIANIVDSRLVVNSYTKEEVYDLDLICNDITFRLCINKEDLLGEPLPGRRFKGNIWMQGKINF
ncbi:DUF3881 family protein [Herbinix luporum]|jgi:hypothetical protein|uniref:DUF3881 family protein n=1 Tax=Herbinix luporum TaxID=1679721 RepID=A0A0K8J9J2_9FIRM|nr:DUF3881 family protein [Herbinix luporum]MDI9488630.1 DUF3881 family protein [Bacillota bacterium]CUH93923.1 hypothetical protein SD1D_2413 [Herbinix luporum]HHT56582.1 DUF3881 family protein [Herbinix luporum]